MRSVRVLLAAAEVHGWTGLYTASCHRRPAASIYRKLESENCKAKHGGEETVKLQLWTVVNDVMCADGPMRRYPSVKRTASSLTSDEFSVALPLRTSSFNLDVEKSST